MDKVSMSYIFSFSRYQTKCVLELLFRQLMTLWTLRFIFDHPLSNGRQVEKEAKTVKQKNEYLENEKSSLDEMKSIFHSSWRAIIQWKNKNLMKIADTSFKYQVWKNCLGQNSFSRSCNVKFQTSHFVILTVFLLLKRHILCARINIRDKYSYFKFFCFTTKNGAFDKL